MSYKANEPSTQRLVAFLEGEATKSESKQLEEQLAQSHDAQRRLQRLGELREQLLAPMPELAGIDLSESIREELKHVPHAYQPPRSASPKRWWGVSAAVLAAVACLVVLRREDLVQSASEYRSKGVRTADTRHWSGIQVYRDTPDGPPERVKAEILRGDGLLFAYANLTQPPFKYLMIFAVDASRQIRWFYPDYQVRGTDPQAIALDSSQPERLLPEVIEHDFAPGPMQIHALFLRHPLHVSEVEAEVTSSHGLSAAFSGQDVRLQTLTVLVQQ